MNQISAEASRIGYLVSPSPWEHLVQFLNSHQRSKEILSIGLTLIILQILDGLFTAVGVQLHGIGAEGNLLIRSLMISWGPALALVFVKTIAIGIICALSVMAFRLSWLPTAMRAIAVLYISCAIIPWSAIILINSF